MAMISIDDLFYGRRESVLILKDEEMDQVLETIHRYDYFYAEPEPKPAENEDGENDSEANSKEDQGKEGSDAKESSNSDEKKANASEAGGKIVFKVPICCHDCEEFVAFALKKVDGVEDVDTFLPKRKVTVIGTAAPTSLLLACRKITLFRKARFWSDDLD